MNVSKLRALRPNLKIKSPSFMQYGVSQRNNQIFESLGQYCCVFTALAIDKTFTQQNFLTSKSEIMSIYFPIKFKNKSSQKFVKI